MPSKSCSIFRKDKTQSQRGVKLIQGFPLSDLDENFRFHHKGRKLEIELTDL